MTMTMTYNTYPLVICGIAIENGTQKYLIYLLRMVIFHSYISLPEGMFVDF